MGSCGTCHGLWAAATWACLLWVARCLPQDDAPLTRIAFGSCANQSAPQPIWDAIMEFDPQLFIWLGDNIYADEKRRAKLWGKARNVGPRRKHVRFSYVSPEAMREKYALAEAVPGYRRLRERAQVVGTWDDHDFGLNDAGKEFPLRDESMQLMLDFVREPQNSPRRTQSGVYAAYTYGPPGKRVKVILLDTRFNRDPLGSDGAMLGEEQWRWFEGQLRGSDAQMHIIGSSIQVVANLTAQVQPLFHVESWSRFPRERARLYALLAATRAPGVVFLSGDVHFGEISRFDCSPAGYPLYDLTSSGLTQAAQLAFKPPAGLLQTLGGIIIPSPMRVELEPGSYGCQNGRPCVYGLPNFGAIRIDWEASPSPSIWLEARGVDGHVALGQRVQLDALRPGAMPPAAPPRRGEVRRHCTLEAELPWHIQYRLAIVVFTALAVLAILPVVGFAALLIGLRWLLLPKRRNGQIKKQD